MHRRQPSSAQRRTNGRFPRPPRRCGAAGRVERGSPEALADTSSTCLERPLASGAPREIYPVDAFNTKRGSACGAASGYQRPEPEPTTAYNESVPLFSWAVLGGDPLASKGHQQLVPSSSCSYQDPRSKSQMGVESSVACHDCRLDRASEAHEGATLLWHACGRPAGFQCRRHAWPIRYVLAWLCGETYQGFLRRPASCLVLSARLVLAAYRSSNFRCGSVDCDVMSASSFSILCIGRC